MSEQSNILNNNQYNSQNNNFLRHAQRSNHYGAVPQENLEPSQNKPSVFDNANICVMIMTLIILGGIALMIILKK